MSTTNDGVLEKLGLSFAYHNDIDFNLRSVINYVELPKDDGKEK